MLAAYFVLILLNVYNAVGDNAYHKHSGSVIYEQYSARETESEKIVTLNLKNKFEENFENTLENRIFEKIKAKLITKVQNKIDEIFSCCMPLNEAEVLVPPEVTAESDITEKENKKTTLRCIASGNPVPQITWSFKDNRINNNVDRYILLPDGALEITSLYRNDSGIYTCVATNEVGTANATVTLSVTEIQVAPQVTADSDITEVENKKATLHCIASGNPVPQIKWSFKDNTIGNNVDRYILLPDGALEITSLYRNDSGIYTCVATNVVGTAQATVTLSVTEMPVPPQVTAESDITEMETKTATLRCIASGNPAPQITWSFGGTIINSDVGRYRLLTDGALEITNLLLSDSSVYTCIAQNPLGNAQAAVTLTVTELQIAPQVITVGGEITEMENKKVTMRCTFSGKPAPKITWSFGGTKIDSNFDRYRLMPDGALEITFLYRNDTGVYTCIAQNAAGTAQSAVTLTVNWNNDWCATTSGYAGNMASKAVVVGLGVCGYHDLWVIRARHGTGLIPGKYDVHTTVASYAMDGTEYNTSEFEIFCSPDPVQWVQNTYGIPANAIIGGFTALGPSGDPLYVGRAVTGSYKTSGMVWNNVLYVPLNGMVYQHTSFEVLCRV